LLSRRRFVTGLGLAGVCVAAAPALLPSPQAMAATVVRPEAIGSDLVEGEGGDALADGDDLFEGEGGDAEIIQVQQRRARRGRQRRRIVRRRQRARRRFYARRRWRGRRRFYARPFRRRRGYYWACLDPYFRYNNWWVCSPWW